MAKIGGPFGNLDFLFFRRAPIFEVDFRGRQGGAKVAYIKAFGRFLDFGIENRVRFWGVPGKRFLVRFLALGGMLSEKSMRSQML